MNTNEGQYEQVSMGLYRSGEQVIAIMHLDGKRLLGTGVNVQAAMLDCFRQVSPGIQAVNTTPQAAWQMPRFEDLPELPEGLDID